MTDEGRVVKMRILSWALRLGRSVRRDEGRRALTPFSLAKDRLWCLHDPAIALPLSDAAILAAVDDFNGELKTNCTAAAEGLLVAVAPLCGQRPSLVRPLMRRALRPLVYLGIERSDQVKQFVEWSLSEGSAYIPHSDASRCWLRDELPKHLLLIQELLTEIAEDTDA